MLLKKLIYSIIRIFLKYLFFSEDHLKLKLNITFITLTITEIMNYLT